MLHDGLYRGRSAAVAGGANGIGFLRRRRRRTAVAANDAAAPVSTSSTAASPPADPAPETLEDLYWALRRNRVTELRIGWRDSNYLQSHRNVHALERALAVNKSVTTVSIGWRSRDTVLWEFLQVLTRASKRLQLTRLQIVLDRGKWIPEHILRALLMQQTGLVELELQSVRVLRRVDSTGLIHKDFCCTDSSEWLSSTPTSTGSTSTVATSAAQHYQRKYRRAAAATSHSSPDKKKNCNHSVISRVLVHMYHHGSLKSIQLTDCDITDKDAVDLAEYLHIRGGLARLSLRGNSRYLGRRGLRMICQAPVMQQLDLSLCDLDPIDVQVVAASIAKRPWPLGELVLCGNYRMDTPGLIALTAPACCDKLIGLNISYCDVGPVKAKKFLESLWQNLSPSSALQQINMQGCRLRGRDGDVADALRRILQKNSSLRVVKINDPSDPQNMGAPELLHLLAGLEFNYEVEELHVDSLANDQESLIRRDMDFLIRLNRAGRRVLRASPPNPAHQQVKRREEPLTRHSTGITNSASGSSHGGSKSPRNVLQVLQQQTARTTVRTTRQLEQQKRKQSDEEWFRVLEKAGADNEELDVLFWMVREGADRFDSNARRQLIPYGK